MLFGSQMDIVIRYVLHLSLGSLAEYVQIVYVLRLMLAIH